MMKQHGNKLMQKWKNKAGVRLSALDKKKLVLTNLPYVLTAFYADWGLLLIQEKSRRRYREQTVICDGTCRSDLYRNSAKF